MMGLTQEQRVKKAHIALMKHPETALYSGVMMMGTTEVTDDAGVTAYTDGINKKYGRHFLDIVCKLDAEVAGLVLHENLHIGLRHLINNRDLFKENRALANKAADYVVNDIIVNIKDKQLVKLPEGGLYDQRFHNMSMREVYRILKKEQEEQEGGDGEGGGSASGGDDYKFDEHGFDENMDVDEAREMDEKIDRALREGALLAGRLGVDVPRSITDMFEPQVDWRDVLRDFIASSTKGNDEYTWRKFNRRIIANDIYLPSMENETVGEVVVAIDTSGSIGQKQIDEFATELYSICEAVEPEAVRVLWWDTKVHGEQLFKPQDYRNIANLLKPLGGGGTKAGCVAEHIKNKAIKAECVIVFTDGYLESHVVWDITMPSLWLVTLNKNWRPPAGKIVKFN
jgi:predicted metal-dependent peptidase